MAVVAGSVGGFIGGIKAAVEGRGVVKFFANLVVVHMKSGLFFLCEYTKKKLHLW
jgi:hypothetical protein